MFKNYRITLNEADTNLCETYKYALISSLKKPVDKAILEIYKHDNKVPDVLSWEGFDTEVLRIKQVYGIGGLYEITLRVYPFYRAHNRYGVDEVKVNSEGELLSFRHLKTYPLMY